MSLKGRDKLVELISSISSDIETMQEANLLDAECIEVPRRSVQKTPCQVNVAEYFGGLNITPILCPHDCPSNSHEAMTSTPRLHVYRSQQSSKVNSASRSSHHGSKVNTASRSSHHGSKVNIASRSSRCESKKTKDVSVRKQFREMLRKTNTKSTLRKVQNTSKLKVQSSPPLCVLVRACRTAPVTGGHYKEQKSSDSIANDILTQL